MRRFPFQHKKQERERKVFPLKDTATYRGNIFWRASKKFQFAADRIIPDSFVFCVVLTFIVFIVAMVLTGTPPLQLLQYWYDGMWTQLTFAMQMSLLVILCAATARSPQVSKFLRWISGIPKSRAAALVMFLVISYVFSFVNWALCSIAAPVFAMQLSKKVRGLHFPMLVAAGYTAMCLGQCLSPAASVYALVATPGHTLEDMIGVLSQSETTYNLPNVIVFVIMAVVIIGVTLVTQPPENELVEYKYGVDDAELVTEDVKPESPADYMNGSHIIMYLVGIGGLVVIIRSFIVNGFLGSLTLNFLIFLFLIVNCFLYNTPTKYVESIRSCMALSCDVMMQFPFYGGIMGIMEYSGFGLILVEGIISFATAATLPVFTFLATMTLNMFIPSQGGMWVVEGRILMDAAQQLGADIPLVINGFVYGDEVTNLLQPLYLIAPLAVVNMKLKDVWGFTAFICVFWIIANVLGLYFVPMLF